MPTGFQASPIEEGQAPPIRLRELYFAFPGGKVLFDQLSLQVPPGASYGILGPNGAGKTSMMKLMLGLLRPQRGEAQLLGQNPVAHPAVFQRVGVLIEGPHLYPHLTARANAEVMCTYRGLSRARIEAVFRQVSLLEDADRQVRQFSTGMKQRLALAIALLPDPGLIVLDEPTQGLDPQGIADMRRIIQGLHREAGKTIVLSSHLLGEVEQICTHLAVVRGGQLLFQGPLDALRARYPSADTIDLEVDDVARAVPVIRQMGYDASAPAPGTLQAEGLRRADLPGLVDALRREGIAIYALRPRARRLEDLFLDVLAKEGGGQHLNTGDHA